MAIHHFRYSRWDGTQDVPDFSPDELLEKMSDDLLRGGDPERALRNLLRGGFQLPDGRRFEGMQRLLQRMREYRQDAFSRYDPNGLVDSVRQKLEEILQMERDEIDRRKGPQGQEPGHSGEAAGEEQGPASPHGESGQQAQSQAGQESQPQSNQ